ncbi:MAG: hypothetical protein IJS60_07300 [Abditibacteriota bacterium]|nr:hypothetical protein [Abditibacteriota bacterium]
MENDFLKFIIDLGSIGAICYIVYLFVKYLSEDRIRRLDEQKEFLRTIENISPFDKRDIRREND